MDVIEASRPKASEKMISAAIISRVKKMRSKSVVPKISPEPTVETIFASAYQFLMY